MPAKNLTKVTVPCISGHLCPVDDGGVAQMGWFFLGLIGFAFVAFGLSLEGDRYKKAGGNPKYFPQLPKSERLQYVNGVSKGFRIGGILVMSAMAIGLLADMVYETDAEKAERQVKEAKTQEKAEQRAEKERQEAAEAAAKEAAEREETARVKARSDLGHEAEYLVRAYFEDGRRLPSDVAVQLSLSHGVSTLNGGMDYQYEKVTEARGLYAGERNGFWNNRWLPAKIAEVKISFANRVAGQRAVGCVHLRWLHDADFEVYREMEASSCDAADREDSEWKQRLSVIRDFDKTYGNGQQP